MSDKPLTEKQARFVAEYLIDLNATQAAIRAGYSEKTARAAGCRLLAHPDIAASVAEAQEERAERTELSQDWVITQLVENVHRAMIAVAVRDREGNETGEWTYQGSVANRALELLGKHLGMFVERKEVTIHEQSDFDREIATLLDEMAARSKAPALCPSPNGSVASNGKSGAASS